jgi:hypothetical protein
MVARRHHLASRKDGRIYFWIISNEISKWVDVHCSFCHLQLDLHDKSDLKIVLHQFPKEICKDDDDNMM